MRYTPFNLVGVSLYGILARKLASSNWNSAFICSAASAWTISIVCSLDFIKGVMAGGVCARVVFPDISYANGATAPPIVTDSYN